MKEKSSSKPKKDEEKEPLTREGFFKILNAVIRPKSEKEKPPKKEKKGTLE